MKKISMYFGVLAISCFLGISNPVVAQTVTDRTEEVRDDMEDDDDDDGGNWGLAGLLGLLGLLGLKRRDHDRHTTVVKRDTI